MILNDLGHTGLRVSALGFGAMHINDERTTDQPGNAYPTTGGVYASTHNSNAPMGAQSTSQVGGQAHENKQPYLVLSYVIAMNGIFPSRS